MRIVVLFLVGMLLGCNAGVLDGSDVDHSSPMGLLVSLHNASWRRDMLSLVECMEPDGRREFLPLIKAQVRCVEEREILALLIEKNFGKKLAERFRAETHWVMLWYHPLPIAFGKHSVDRKRVSVQVRNHIAVVQIDQGGSASCSLMLKRIGDRWYLDKSGYTVRVTGDGAGWYTAQMDAFERYAILTMRGILLGDITADNLDHEGVNWGSKWPSRFVPAENSIRGLEGQIP